jgi:hypothetical protein
MKCRNCLFMGDLLVKIDFLFAIVFLLFSSCQKAKRKDSPIAANQLLSNSLSAPQKSNTDIHKSVNIADSTEKKATISTQPKINVKIDKQVKKDGLISETIFTNETNLYTEYAITKTSEHGSFLLVDENIGLISYQPALLYFGPDQISLTAKNSNQETVSIELGIQVKNVNHPPIAIEQTLRIDKDEPIQAEFLVSDVDSVGLRYEIRNAPQYGTVQLLEGNKFTYTLVDISKKTDQFTYRVSDGENSVESTVNVVKGFNYAPIATNSSCEVPEDSLFASCRLNAKDQDGDALQYNVTIDSINLLPSTCNNLALRTNVDPHGLLLIQNIAKYCNGIISLSFFASDGQSKSNQGTVRLTVTKVYHQPVVYPISYTYAYNNENIITLRGFSAENYSLQYRILSIPPFGKIFESDGTEITTVPYVLSSNVVKYVYQNDPNEPANLAVFTFNAFTSEGTPMTSDNGNITINLPTITPEPISTVVPVPTPTVPSGKKLYAHLNLDRLSFQSPNDSVFQSFLYIKSTSWVNSDFKIVVANKDGTTCSVSEVSLYLSYDTSRVSATNSIENNNCVFTLTSDPFIAKIISNENSNPGSFVTAQVHLINRQVEQGPFPFLFKIVNNDVHDDLGKFISSNDQLNINWNTIGLNDPYIKTPQNLGTPNDFYILAVMPKRISPDCVFPVTLKTLYPLYTTHFAVRSHSHGLQLFLPNGNASISKDSTVGDRPSTTISFRENTAPLKGPNSMLSTFSSQDNSQEYQYADLSAAWIPDVMIPVDNTKRFNSAFVTYFKIDPTIADGTSLFLEFLPYNIFYSAGMSPVYEHHYNWTKVNGCASTGLGYIPSILSPIPLLPVCEPPLSPPTNYIFDPNTAPQILHTYSGYSLRNGSTTSDSQYVEGGVSEAIKTSQGTVEDNFRYGPRNPNPVDYFYHPNGVKKIGQIIVDRTATCSYPQPTSL